MSDILNSLIVYNPSNQKVRYGSSYGSGDGGYVVIDGYNYDFYIGCGVGDNVSFDLDFTRKYSDVFGQIFDGNVHHCPFVSDKIEFVNKNIFPHDSEIGTSLNNESANYKDIFLKMDIEGHEWNWINAYQHFSNIKQMAIEIHGIFDPSWTNLGNFKYEDICTGLGIINQTHYLVHIHANNAGVTMDVEGHRYPTVAELTYIRKADCEINGFNTTPLPINGLDYMNSMNGEYIDMNKWPFVFGDNSV